MTDTKIKAQGAKGDDAIAPQVQINATTNEWEISTDGGKNWKSTGIKATGEKGDRGDAVFAENGVDYTSDITCVVHSVFRKYRITSVAFLPGRLNPCRFPVFAAIR